MIAISDITSFDVIVVLIFLLFLVRGTWIGLMRQIAAFLALVLSYWLAGQYSERLMPYVDTVIENPKIVFFISFAVLFILGTLLFILFGKILNLVMEISLVNWFDRLLGSILGMVKGLLVTSFLYMVMSSALPSANELANKSLCTPVLARGSGLILEVINDSALRGLFLPKEPAIVPETDKAPDSSGKGDIQPGAEVHLYENDRK